MRAKQKRHPKSKGLAYCNDSVTLSPSLLLFVCLCDPIPPLPFLSLAAHFLPSHSILYAHDSYQLVVYLSLDSVISQKLCILLYHSPANKYSSLQYSFLSVNPYMFNLSLGLLSCVETTSLSFTCQSNYFLHIFFDATKTTPTS